MRNKMKKYKINFMKQENKTQEALRFAISMRGRYILSQALHYAIKELKKVKSPHTEISNISDMEYLRDNIFNFYFEVSKEDLKKLGKK